ncbi:hypothetical protein BN134_4028 [Cronobacter dublinensis 1210]|uniref:Uncharacterized protein n=1 Tax=Cronobacter dublinensis 1210 TaxID=1208656 RepID=A0ABM9QCD9_9ENTR|nr:hypothetical protein BN134_4028 [Cronobacter dublinensis 1210]CCJ87908.1 hypothetical protein BN133_4285 [Cronobacter dublinensis 582]
MDNENSRRSDAMENSFTVPAKARNEACRVQDKIIVLR